MKSTCTPILLLKTCRPKVKMLKVTKILPFFYSNQTQLFDLIPLPKKAVLRTGISLEFNVMYFQVSIPPFNSGSHANIGNPKIIPVLVLLRTPVGPNVQNT